MVVTYYRAVQASGMRYCRCGGGRYGRFCLLGDRLVRVSDRSERVYDQLTVNLNRVRDRGETDRFLYFCTFIRIIFKSKTNE